MLQESRGESQAVSRSGAIGLMQVMPRDGKAATFMCINGPCFADRPSMQELFDPQFNVSYGTQLLAGLIQRNGSVRDGLRAYGPRDSGYSYADIVLQIYNSH
jgi:soluble lytic murein transglycosylase-like protein